MIHYPILKTQASSRTMVDAFSGYNHNLRISEAEFYDMKNLTSDLYPVLSPRKKRGTYHNSGDVTGIIAKDNLCYTEGSYFVMNEHRVDMGLTDGPKQLISMGAYVIIMPDKKWINTENLKNGITNNDGEVTNLWSSIEAGFTAENGVSFELCALDGSDYDNALPSPTEPANPQNMDYWIDTSVTPHTLKQYSESSSMWIPIATTYIKISAAGIGTPFEVYDGVTISGVQDPKLQDLNASMVIWDKADDYIVVIGILDSIVIQTDPITVTRQMPAMDYIVESGNRLWGCRYGLSNNGKVVNEIYASKLGDFKNWNCFMGLSSDSYAASCGTDGAFTGAITHLGYPLFFKENCVHKVYGNYPANFQIQDTACTGVQNGCAKSLAIVNSTLFYKARSGICAYDGSLPSELSYALGNEAYSQAVGGAHGSKYYVSMENADGSHLFVYDAAKGMWHKEDSLSVDAFCSCRGEMYALSDGNILGLLGTGTAEGNIEWMAETGDLGLSSPDMKYISRLTVRMALEANTTVQIFIQYDMDGNWIEVCNLTSTHLRSFYLPIMPRRCDHMKLKITGTGEAKIYSIVKTIEQGSDIS